MTEQKPGFDLRDFIQNYRRNPVSFWVLLGLAVLGLLLLIGGNRNEKERTTGAVTPQVATEQVHSPVQADEGRLERELKETLSAITGAGRVRVELMIKSGRRRIWERQSRSNRRVSGDRGTMNNEEDSSDELVLAKDRDGRDTPVLKEELAPEIQGVIVVASGATDIEVRRMLTSTVMTILGLPAHRVLVIPGEERGSNQ